MNNRNERNNNHKQEERDRQHTRQDVRNGFGGMNFEEQRGSLKNSDLGGAVRDKQHGIDEDRQINR
jgi:hypothetical protein